MHKLICEDEHMSLLRKKACELCESHFTPLFEVRQDPSTNNANWHMTNASGSINFSLTSDISEMDLVRRFALLHKNQDENQDEECGICYENNKEVSCHKCGERHCYECYIRLFEAGQGVITCPFCRTSTGQKMTSRELAYGISHIKHRVNELKKMREIQREIQEEKKLQNELVEITADDETASKKAERQRQRRKAKKKRVAAAKANQHRACHKIS